MDSFNKHLSYLLTLYYFNKVKDTERNKVFCPHNCKGDSDVTTQCENRSDFLLMGVHGRNAYSSLGAKKDFLKKVTSNMRTKGCIKFRKGRKGFNGGA